MCLGIPGQIVAICDADNHLAMVEVSGVQREVNIICIVEPNTRVQDYVGEWVLVHVGFAMSHLDEAEAQRTLTLLAELGELQKDEEDAGPNTGANKGEFEEGSAP
ncbi:HypC/HybG/HupF family hydrogenase formation chaperone [Ketobacter sp.]|uniref:HypC/HybG/HupF family hydrogenase formation chaperone n=1 Tax=Ketobacter sp. TaxID=2083498 RepID=UPI000F18469D|nr:HypC/HybG/HupF family hydrogenase formation chaperone [Ketobacter sp.]RLU00199.1 MAG: HypC/HybG/HupF family hydrogenase formation chaperone [Ketobacter sp.]